MMTNPKMLKQFSIAKVVKTFLLYLGVFLLIYTGINYLRKPVIPTHATLQFRGIDGQSLDLAKLSKKQAVLVYFWGTWCGVCRQTTPLVQSLNSVTYPVVSIAVQSGDNAKLANYASQHQLDFAVINDSEGELFRAWQGQVTPSYVIVSHGKVVQSFTGIQPAWVLKSRMAWVNLFG